MAVDWTEERVELLATLWRERRTASQIAAEFGPAFTRNAILGKIHRLGLSGSTRQVQVVRRVKPPIATEAPAQPASAAPPPVLPAPPPPPAPALAPVIALPDPVEAIFGHNPVAMATHRLGRDHCRYPIGDPRVPDPQRPFRFCGEPVVAEGKPYCTEHHRRCCAGTVRQLVAIDRAKALYGRAA